MIDIDHKDNILRTFILFFQTAKEVLRYSDVHLNRKANLSLIKLIVLRILASNNGVMNPSKIAEWTQTEQHNITALADRMKRDGLVTTKRNRSDRRVVNIIITSKGREVLSQAMPVAREIVNNVMLSLSEADATLLEKALRILRQNAHYGFESDNKHSQSLSD